MSSILRYIDEKNQVFERLVGFLNCHDKSYDNANFDEELQVNEPKFTGDKLGDTVISILKSIRLSVTLPASRLLQSYDRDIADASDIIDDIILNLSGKRSNCESDFSQLFEQSKNVMNKLDIDLKLPRIAKRQTQRSNNPAQSLEEYYRRVLYIPLLENISEDLQHVFLIQKLK
ncbi:hypothetical protein QTP88_019801 [Uroleucon formosanum]